MRHTVMKMDSFLDLLGITSSMGLTQITMEITIQDGKDGGKY